MTPTWFNTETRLASLRWLAGSLDRTPFFANSEAPGLNGGMDCVHLLNYIYRQCGVIPSLWIPRQTMDHGQHSERSLLIEAFETWPALVARFTRLPECSPADILPGDALCFTAGKVPHHGAVALEGGDIFHTLAPYGAHRMQLRAVIRGEKILGKLAAVYRPTPDLRALNSQLSAFNSPRSVAEPAL